ncbi:MAG: NADase-type glycan-binding domain-containing protein [Actinomycetes bacterium]
MAESPGVAESPGAAESPRVVGTAERAGTPGMTGSPVSTEPAPGTTQILATAEARPFWSGARLLVALAVVVLLGTGLGVWWFGVQEDPVTTKQAGSAPRAISEPRATPDAATGTTGEGGGDANEGTAGQASGDARAGTVNSRTIPLPAPPPDWGSNLASFAEVFAPGQSQDSQDNAGNLVTYDPANLTDGVPETAWRMDGDASGRSLTVVLPYRARVTHVGLINGYAKTDAAGGRDDRYLQNRRVTSVTWRFEDGTRVRQQMGRTRDLQYIPVPGRHPSTAAVTMTIESTSGFGTKGTRAYDFTAVSEIAVFGD